MPLSGQVASSAVAGPHKLLNLLRAMPQPQVVSALTPHQSESGPLFVPPPISFHKNSEHDCRYVLFAYASSLAHSRIRAFNGVSLLGRSAAHDSFIKSALFPSLEDWQTFILFYIWGECSSANKHLREIQFLNIVKLSLFKKKVERIWRFALAVLSNTDNNQSSHASHSHLLMHKIYVLELSQNKDLGSERKNNK